jgi:hypothetical protein
MARKKTSGSAFVSSIRKELAMCSVSFIQRFGKLLRLASFAMLLACFSYLVSTPSAFATTQSPARHASGPGGQGLFVQTATTSNTSGDSTFINNSAANGNPGIGLLVTANWDPGSVYTGFDDHLVGVWYDSWLGEWAIFNEDGSAMPVGAQFNVLVNPYDIQTATVNTVLGYEMFISGAGIGGPQDLIIVTPNFSPNGVFDNHPLGLWYDSLTGLWVVYHEDLTPIQIGETFNFFIEGAPLPPFYNTIVTADKTGYACTTLGSSTSPFFLAHIYTNGYITGVTGLLFTGTEWCVFEDGHLLPAGTEFFLTLT